ncbi:hypothetical protein [Paracoccus sp. MKU1]|uniref:hypothetical protein n=1 Tax=Paracoccus sp. MKU1 TaxID=1745182 RepID=UPI00071916C9|nr:hypothetical protein [Paracoccus sp. MKU1]KRW96244.1 hypothetical protein AQY21_10190 [Paracoccus sp. MKU1]
MASVTLRMSRKQFNGMLHSLSFDPMKDDSWKVADIDFSLDEKGEELARGFDRIEVFSYFPGGPIVALHDFETDSVVVICPKPGPGIYRTDASIVAEMRGEAA